MKPPEANKRVLKGSVVDGVVCAPLGKDSPWRKRDRSTHTIHKTQCDPVSSLFFSLFSKAWVLH